jgi:hypothetical protein
LAISRTGPYQNWEGSIWLFLQKIGVATKTCDKTLELPLEECYHIFPNYRGIYFLKNHYKPQNGTDDQNLGVWLTIYIFSVIRKVI